MKKLFLAVVLFVSYFTYAQTIEQTLSYNDIGELFSKETINGSARFNSMSGAFGALGGDLSAIDINPAGAVVFTKSEVALSLDNKTIKTNALFYGVNQSSENENLNFSQAGGVMVFKTNRNSDWGKFALSLNYAITNDYNNSYTAKGNSGYAPITDIYDPEVVYLNSDGHYFENYTDGRSEKYTFTFASEYKNNLMLGFSLSTYNIEHYQRILTDEYNNDGEGNTLDIYQKQELATFGDGISLNFGLITKPNENLRIGLAYQSPIWYTLNEEYLEYDADVYESITNSTTNDYSGINGFDYKLKTPSKLTGSLAYIFNKSGLISLDYIYKNYSNIKLSNGDFSYENQGFKDGLESTTELRLGTEWRFEAFSFRGGYHYEKNPKTDAYQSDDIEGYSLGAGIKFRGGRFDISYLNSKNTDFYNFYKGNTQVNSAELDIDTSKITATLVLNI
ncbi:OmpP1/FadL family transporter [Lutibacter sp.]|uniref:OmpP1/FadL family transporter n=1 Tax=Lutibacter sp. TaxID=1925666 RepID=UPI003568D888